MDLMSNSNDFWSLSWNESPFATAKVNRNSARDEFSEKQTDLEG